MAYQIQGLDLPSVFLAAQHARANEQKMQFYAKKDAEEERQRIKELNTEQGLRSYYGEQPDDRILLQVNPALHAKIKADEQAIAEKRGEFQMKQQEANFKKAENTSRVALGALAQAEKNPTLIPKLREYTAKLAQQGMIGPIEIPDDPATIGQYIKAYESQLIPFETDLIQNAKFADKSRAPGIVEKVLIPDRGPSTIVNNNYSPDEGGNMKLPKSLVEEQMRKVIEGRKDLVNIDRLENLGDRREWTGMFANVVNQALGLASSFDERLLSPEQKDRLGRARTAYGIIEGLFLKAKLEATGQAAALGEIEQLRKALISTDLDPVSFDAALNRLIEMTQDNVEVGESLLVQGLSVLSPNESDAFRRFSKDRRAGRGDDKKETPKDAPSSEDAERSQKLQVLYKRMRGAAPDLIVEQARLDKLLKSDAEAKAFKDSILKAASAQKVAAP